MSLDVTIFGVSFDYIWLLPLAVLLPALAFWAVRRSWLRRQQRFAKLGELDVVSRLVPPGLTRPVGWRMARVATAAALLGIAVSGPRWGIEKSAVRTKGIDMVLALDASLSMMATDDKPNRLERLKQEVRRLRELSRGDRVGMLAFAGRSYVLSPLTVDAGALDLFLDNLDPSVVGQAGSSVARTIRQGTDLLMLSNSGADKALVVMTDGEAFEDEADIIAEAKRAGEQGIYLVTVGFGSPQGANIPVKAADGSVELKRDDQGQVVVSRYDPKLLQAAAEAAKGTFIPSEQSDKAGRIRQALSSLRTQARTINAGDTNTPRFQLFLFPAVLLLILDTFLGDLHGRRRKRAAAETTAIAASLLFVLALNGCARPEDSAARAWRSSRFADAANGYRTVMENGDRTPRALYNYGTALVAADSLDRAAEALERAVDSPDAEEKYRATFNLGLVHLKKGLSAEGDAGAPELDAALALYKKAILERPTDMDAVWNYELALRKKQEGGGGGGGGGGGNSQDQPSPDAQAPTPAGGLGQSQADQLLGSAAREERQVQAKRQKQSKVEPPPGGKDW